MDHNIYGYILVSGLFFQPQQLLKKINGMMSNHGHTHQ